MNSIFTDASLHRNDEDRKNERKIAFWFLFVAFMVVTIMLIGAITRLTDSGLSMTEWRPFVGWLPPLSQEEWARVFDLYQQTSQYALINKGMTLAEFKEIFFWEYIHRLWGRLTGLAYIIPFLWFTLRGEVPKKYRLWTWVLLFTIVAQGIVGWWMVQSGLVERVDVSHFRLAVHLGLAFIIFGILFYIAIRILWPVKIQTKAAPRWFRRLCLVPPFLIFLTLIYGAFVAGSDAGFIYNDWPLMGENWYPEELTYISGWGGLVHAKALIQFVHRTLAYGTFLFILALTMMGVFLAVRLKQPRLPRWFISLVVLENCVLVQILLGIVALISVVSLPIAVLHQLGAVIAFSAALWVVKETEAGK